MGKWTFLFTFGYTLDIYASGLLRVAIDRATGRKVISYLMNKKEIKEAIELDGLTEGVGRFGE